MMSQSYDNHVGFILNRELHDKHFLKKKILDGRFTRTKNFYRKNLFAHFGCVNAIEFSKDGKLLASGGDDKRVLIWEMHKALHGKPEPIIMKAQHASNVFALAFDSQNKRIFSAGNDDQVVIHDITTKKPIDVFLHEQPVYGISIDPLNDNVFASACDDGRLLIYDIRSSNYDPFCLMNYSAAFHSVMFNPAEPRLLVAGNSREGAALWDIRVPKKFLVKYGFSKSEQYCMSVRFSQNGKNVLALRRRLPPVLYSIDSGEYLFQFNHDGYFNSCTMKSCSFGGENDEYVLSGSDNFDLYMWKIPEPGSHKWIDQAHHVLQGHRSIVNQVRYNSAYSVVASSGVEKLIKIWSPFPIPHVYKGKAVGNLSRETDRTIFSQNDYINLVMQSSQFMSLTFDTTRKNTKEDPRMMAFFDALIQRDIEGISENDDRATPKSQSASNENSSSSDDGNSDFQSRLRALVAAERTTIANTSTRPNMIVRNQALGLRHESDSPSSPLEEDVEGFHVDFEDNPTESVDEEEGENVENEVEVIQQIQSYSSSEEVSERSVNIITKLISKKFERVKKKKFAKFLLESSKAKEGRMKGGKCKLSAPQDVSPHSSSSRSFCSSNSTKSNSKPRKKKREGGKRGGRSPSQELESDSPKSADESPSSSSGSGDVDAGPKKEMHSYRRKTIPSSHHKRYKKNRHLKYESRVSPEQSITPPTAAEAHERWRKLFFRAQSTFSDDDDVQPSTSAAAMRRSEEATRNLRTDARATKPESKTESKKMSLQAKRRKVEKREGRKEEEDTEDSRNSTETTSSSSSSSSDSDSSGPKSKKRKILPCSSVIFRLKNSSEEETESSLSPINLDERTGNNGRKFKRYNPIDLDTDSSGTSASEENDENVEDPPVKPRKGGRMY